MIPNRKVLITKYDPQWPDLFENEKSRIEHFNAAILLISHVGSTSIPGMVAKPIIDILCCIKTDADFDLTTDIFIQNNYILFDGLIDKYPGKRILWKGTNETHTHHIHLTKLDSFDHHRLIAFRDKLCDSNRFKSMYSDEKIRLSNKYPDDINMYVQGKSEIYKHIFKYIDME